jgi:Xaa-Pro aminopeptidase
MNERPPVLSLRERDRRWQRVRDLMRAHELECLIVGGYRGRERYECYITDDYVEGAVIFPLGGEPTALTWTGLRISRAWESFRRGEQPWVADLRLGVTGPALADVIREKGLDRGRIGIVGVDARSPTEPEGYLPARVWTSLLDALSGATIVDVSMAFAELVLVKGEEELALVRYAARIGEAASRAMADVTRPGVGEEQIYGEMMRVMYAHAADARYPGLILQSGPHTTSWGPPRWLYRAEHPRRVQRGDMVQAEIFPCYGNQEVQVQMAVALDPIDELNQRCEAVARESYDVGLKTMRPGITVADLVRAMEQPLREAGCWAKTPLFHSLNPQCWFGRTAVGLEQLEGTEEGRIETPAVHQVIGGDLVLRPGMVFAFEPNACLGTHRVNIGGGVVVTDNGCEALNDLPTRVHHVA